jgi:dTMP kinase
MSKLISIEGCDGAGKSTQVELVKKYFKNHKLSFSFFHFPMYGHNEFSDIIARFLRGEFGGIDKVSPYFVANIYAMDRFMFLPILKEALKTVDVVLLDRYVFSNIAYQAAKYPLASKETDDIRTWILNFEFDFLNLPYPDLNIFFDVPIKITKERLETKREGSDRDYLNGKQDIHEADFEFQERVRQNYLDIMAGVNSKIIPCTIAQKDKYLVIPPKDLFKMHVKPLLDYTLFGDENPDFDFSTLDEKIAAWKDGGYIDK